jgi:hypothetical protein
MGKAQRAALAATHCQFAHGPRRECQRLLQEKVAQQELDAWALGIASHASQQEAEQWPEEIKNDPGMYAIKRIIPVVTLLTNDTGNSGHSCGLDQSQRALVYSDAQWHDRNPKAVEKHHEECCYGKAHFDEANKIEAWKGPEPDPRHRTHPN